MMQDIADELFHDQVDKREKWMQVFKSDIWKPIYEAPLSAHREQAYRQLKAVANSGIVSVLNFVDDPTNIFTAHEMIGMVNSSTVTKFTVHYNLFGGTIVALHTERHKSIFQKLDNMSITGCFCLTELGYGNNAVQMETTATYDPNTQEFIINTPSTLAQKYWITNGSVHANQALVFAQTVVKGKNEGVNAFLVPIRDEKLKKFDGVEINEMGYKIGLNGVDNAALQFHNVHIPRVNMMNRYCDVDEHGNFSSAIKGIQERFFKVTERLLSGRLCIASMTLGTLKRQVYITIKYSKQRKGVSPNGKSETPIFEYQLQKNALVPLVSRMLALNMLHNFSKRAFANPKAHQNDLLMICCIDKTLVGWHAERSGAIMRQRCGGQGFLAANRFGQLIAGAHAALTAEGDNRVLMIKIVKDMLNIFKKNPNSFHDGSTIKITNASELRNLDTLVTLFAMWHQHLLTQLISKMLQLKQKGLSNYEILMFNTSDEVQLLAQSYGECLTLKECRKSLQRLSDKGQEIMTQHYTIFAWEIILREALTFYMQGWINKEIIQNMRQEYNTLIKQAASTIEHIIESLNVPAHALYAPIAADYVVYNQKPYEGEVINAKM